MPICFGHDVVRVVFDPDPAVTEDTVAAATVVAGGAVGRGRSYGSAEPLSLAVHSSQELGLESFAFLQ